MTAPVTSRNWTVRLRQHAVRELPPERLMPGTQPVYVASWIYVFGVLTLSAFVVVLASGSAARAYAWTGGKAPAVSIGPETTRVAESVGLEVAVEADAHDLDGLVAAVQTFAREHEPAR